MTYTINIIIKIIIATAAAILFGNGSVVAFNHLPQKWFEDWEGDGDDAKRILPDALLAADNAGRQRLASTPWKYIFTGLFLVTGAYLVMSNGVKYEIATLCMLAVVLEMSIADQLYKTVPDQLQIMLAVTALGFAESYEDWWEPLAGAGVGLALGLAVLGLGLLIFRTGSMGGADIKFFTVIGLITGRRGVLIVFILTTLFFATESVFRIASGRGSIKDHIAMIPAGFAAVLVYMLFLWNRTELWLMF